MESGDEIEVSIETSNTFKVKKCGIHLLVNEPDVLVKYESMVQQVDSDIASARDGTMHGHAPHSHGRDEGIQAGMVRVLKNQAIMEALVMVMDITHIRETLLV
ncbi:hypothetical protein FCV25MIE_28257 [Fagus crenata]